MPHSIERMFDTQCPSEACGANSFDQDVGMRSARSRRIWDEDGLIVEARLTNDGELVFAGHDLSSSPFGDEYEYWVTVPAKEIPTVISALDGQHGVDVLGLVAHHAASIIRQGERAWVRSRDQAGLPLPVSVHPTGNTR